MGTPPGKIVRWGTTLIFSVFILFIFFAWIIRYPDKVLSPVEITTENPPVTLVSKITGNIKHLYVKDEEEVIKGQILAVMETAASMRDIMALRTFVDTLLTSNYPDISDIPELKDLGELQASFGIYRKCVSDLSAFLKNDYYGNKIISVRQELEGLGLYLAQLRESERLISENLKLEMNRFRRDSILSSGKTIPDAELERSRQELNRQRIDLQTIRLEISGKKIDEISKNQLLSEYSIRRREETDKLSSAVDEALSNLMAQNRIWENMYLLISSINGKVTFTRFWSENQTVKEGEAVLSIVPSEQGGYLGRVNLGMQRSGKVDTGQIVYVKLSSFPYLEYGMIQGRVRSKSLVPAGDAYIIEIDLTKGLRTLYGKDLSFTQNMLGTAEIITDDRSLLSRILSPFRYLLSVN